MKTKKYKKSFFAGFISLVVGTSCCWLSSLALWLGGATTLGLFSQYITQYQGIIVSIAILFFAIGIYQLWKFNKNKKSKSILSVILLFLSISAFAQSTNSKASDIIGKWKIHDNRATIEIYKKKDVYYGKIVSLQKSVNSNGKKRTDIYNPIETNRQNKLIGLVVLNNFVYQKGKYINGKAYDPDSGGTYDCKLWLSNKNTLKVRDYCGIFYKTFTWTRVP